MQLTSRRAKNMLVPWQEQKRCKTSDAVHSGCFLGSLRLLVLLERLIREQPDVVMETDASLLFYLQDDVGDEVEDKLCTVPYQSIPRHRQHGTILH